MATNNSYWYRRNNMDKSQHNAIKLEPEDGIVSAGSSKLCIGHESRHKPSEDADYLRLRNDQLRKDPFDNLRAEQSQRSVGPVIFFHSIQLRPVVPVEEAEKNGSATQIQIVPGSVRSLCEGGEGNGVWVRPVVPVPHEGETGSGRPDVVVHEENEDAEEDIPVCCSGIFRRTPRPSATRGCPFTSQGRPALKKKMLLVIYDTSSIGSHLKCLKCVKT
jgi:hypothetical protein